MDHLLTQWFSASPVGLFKHADTYVPSLEIWEVVLNEKSLVYISKDALSLYKLIDTEDLYGNKELQEYIL